MGTIGTLSQNIMLSSCNVTISGDAVLHLTSTCNSYCLHDDSIMFCDKVPIVPIHKFASFVEEFYGNLEKMDIIEKSS